MSQTSIDNLLARLAADQSGGDDAAWHALAATQPQHATPSAAARPRAADAAPAAAVAAAAPPTAPAPRPASHQPVQDASQERLHELIKRVAGLAGAPDLVRDQPLSARSKPNTFVPLEPQSLREAHVSEPQLEALLLKFLLARGGATGRDCAEQVKLSFKIVDERLRQLKAEQLVVYSGTAPMNDYSYDLTELGRERARRLSQLCTYYGAAPVCLEAYVASVAAQSLTRQHPTAGDLRHAFADLLISDRMLSRLGPAINSARGLFLYGSAGNGKTSIAERVTRAFGETIWIPRAIGIDGEIIRVFDPVNHEEVPLAPHEGLLDQRHIDARWVRVRRPTIVVGGELRMENLEVTFNPVTSICEAPLQVKSNCGTLVIDDFGRQQVSTHELLNRWIVPLEKRFDFLNLPNGKKVQVPFDQLIIFSTNLEPRDLVDEAFLRRIPYKIDVPDASEEDFRRLFRMMAEKLEVEYHEDALDYLIEVHYRPVQRPFRNCHPRDLLLQIKNFCCYQNLPPVMTREYFDFAVENYFAVM